MAGRALLAGCGVVVTACPSEDGEVDGDACTRESELETTLPVLVRITNDTDEEVFIQPAYEDNVPLPGGGDSSQYFCDVPRVRIYDANEERVEWPRPSPAGCDCDASPEYEEACICANCEHEGKLVRIAAGATYQAGVWSGTAFATRSDCAREPCEECYREYAVEAGRYTIWAWGGTTCEYQSGSGSTCPLCELNEEGWCEQAATPNSHTHYTGVIGSVTIDYPRELIADIHLEQT